jgi:sn-glycerol 3-phosphate transport system permease protein
MVERSPVLDVVSHVVLALGVLVIAFPVYVTLVASTQTSQEIVQAPMSLLPGDNMLETYRVALIGGETSYGAKVPPVGRMMWVSLVSALVITIGKIAISLLSAFAFVYFRFPGRSLCFWLVFVTLMLPVEVRIFPTYKVVSDLGMLNTYAGLTIPLIASATATFLFRQFFLTVPEELCEAARIDGASPLHFFRHVLLPLSVSNMVALSIILFLYGWNQYLWPLLFTTDKDMATAVIGLKHLIPQSDSEPAWNVAMNAALLVMLPPALVVVALQRWLVKGLVDSGK